MIYIYIIVVFIGLFLFLASSLSIANTNDPKKLKKLLFASIILFSGFISLLICLILK